MGAATLGFLDGWRDTTPLFEAGLHLQLLDAVAARREQEIVYPAVERIFYALERTPFEKVRVVIVGQDPYHGPGQADGLAFSVPEGMPAPPSLRNIFREVARDIYAGAAPQFSTDLTRWADQGVLLLNAVLTVAAGRPGSHRCLGWETLTDGIIAALSEQREGLVFMLWGAYAQSKRVLIAEHGHLVLEAPHPSPLSAYRGFLGCGHFSRANAWLRAHNGWEITW
ncbi:MAG: uracil-DNA glycosylase [Anaerolineae bacterium]|nr:uracil-DNA glycosylase [Anaerolineae bacterium]